VTEARERIAQILAAHLADAELPPAPPERARQLAPETQRRKRRRAARDKRGARAEAVERLQAQLSRAATRSGEAYRPALRIPGRTWSMAAAVVADRSGRTAGSALGTLPLALRHRARAELGDLRPLLARYRAALLVALHQLSRPSRARRRGRRVVSGFSRGALAALLRAPANGERLSVSRVYGRNMNARPILPWLADRGLLAREQPGRGARGVPRGPSGYALGLYYLDGDAEQFAPQLAPALRSLRGPVTLSELLARPPD
jgi:hypothetical protein